ncbi:MAG: bifunctional methylenetetrahydrofolate dehydrogenase/methenyltetrahydrofolate cyclohydrolase [Candidatus Aminicenantes bacterium]|nr:bifunctional methylenetetrahydrofolate dehydrogenase/methenyltetrahydrofolate cyclohydrolase [Candidatus Aminicenantes bacterium]
MGQWLEGRTLAKKIKEKVKEEVLQIKKERNEVPGLAAVLVGDNKASQVYVGMKQRTCERLGIFSEILKFKADLDPAELKRNIQQLNDRDQIDGILVQEPLPSSFSSHEVATTIQPEKDVDGLNPCSLGNLLRVESGLRPCTPLGIMELLKSQSIEIKGKEVVIIGRSLLVGKPLAAMMTNAHGTVTLCHSRTKTLPQVASRADILVAAMGRGAFVTPDFVKKGAVVIDVGINHLTDKEKVKELFPDPEKRLADIDKKGYTLIGDVMPAAIDKSSMLTPVPGGVGPLTVALLMHNTLKAYKSRRMI